MKNNIIGIGGLAGSGKTTLAKYIQGQTGQNIVAFADPLKEVVALLTGCNKKDLDNSEFKSNVLGPEWNHKTNRFLLQKIGTDLLRNQLNENVWVNALFAKYNTNIVIGDVRFPNELQAIKDRGGITVYINRELNLKQEHIHSSENAVNQGDFDYVINNTGSIENMFKELDNLNL